MQKPRQIKDALVWEISKWQISKQTTFLNRLIMNTPKAKGVKRERERPTLCVVFIVIENWIRHGFPCCSNAHPNKCKAHPNIRYLSRTPEWHQAKTQKRFFMLLCWHQVSEEVWKCDENLLVINKTRGVSHCGLAICIKKVS